MNSTEENKKRVRLGPFEIEHPFFLAPMAGITNSPFRKLMRELGSSLVVSELVSATGIEYASQKTFDLLKFDPSERTVGLQIFGEDEEELAKACIYIEKLGADFVDLNLGCPVPKVVKKGAGAALCRNPIHLHKILKKMVQSVKIPVTIKIRTGWDAQTRNALDCVNAAADAGVSWVAIHGRTRAQGYSGLADWDFIGTVKAKSPIPIIGNGDVQTAEIALARYKDFGVDAVMIGRGALRNPFIFRQAFDLYSGRQPFQPTAKDYTDLILRQKIGLTKGFSEKASLIHARKFLSWYSAGFPGSSEFRSKVFSGTDPEKFWQEALDFFEKSFANRTDQYMSEPFLMGGHG